MRHRGKITHWKDDRGFGFITPKGGGKDVFVHVNSFDSRPDRPAENEEVSFKISRDSRGRPSAAKVRFAHTRVSFSGFAMRANSRLAGCLLFFILLTSATLAGKLPITVLGIYGLASLATLGIYAWDKSAARTDRQRTPEKTLHVLALIGGWPGALAAQHLFRHKSRKKSFQAVFWITVVANCIMLYLLYSPEGAEFFEALLKTTEAIATPSAAP